MLGLLKEYRQALKDRDFEDREPFKDDEEGLTVIDPRKKKGKE